MKNKGFTLSEVLITLGIIGVIAAMTIPGLVAKHRKIETVTKLKKIWMLLANAQQMSIYENGPSKQWEYPCNSTEITVTEFFNKYYRPYLKVDFVKRKRHKVYNQNGTDSFYDQHFRDEMSNNVFRTNDGICITPWNNNQFLVFGVDLNCENPPNIIGRDVFDVAELYWFGRHLNVPEASSKPDAIRNNSIYNCKTYVYVGWPVRCFSIIYYDNWEIKDDYPIKF